MHVRYLVLHLMANRTMLLQDHDRRLGMAQAGRWHGTRRLPAQCRGPIMLSAEWLQGKQTPTLISLRCTRTSHRGQG